MPVFHREYHVGDEFSRQTLTIIVSILLGVVFGILGDWIRDEWKTWRRPGIAAQADAKILPPVGGKETPSKAPQPTKRRSWLRIIGAVLIVAALVLLASVAYVIVSTATGRPILYYQRTSPVRIHVMVEETADMESLRGTYEVVVAALRVILGNDDVTAEFSTFADDGITTYNFDTPGIYGPAGRREWNIPEIQSSGRVDIYMVHHDGRSSVFRAFNWQAVNVFVGDHDVSPLGAATVALHELGHGWGLRHNPCSPTMRIDERLVFPDTAPGFAPLEGFLLDGIDVYAQTVNRSLTPPSSWGELVSMSRGNLAYQSSDRRMTRDIYLFKSSDGEVFRQIIWTHSEDLVGNSDWDSVSFSMSRTEAFLYAWSPAELWYISASSWGKSIEPPEPTTEC